MKVTQVSTWDTPCGIAHYTRFLGQALAAEGVEVGVVPIDLPLMRRIARADLDRYVAQLADRATADADVVHVQHEFAFFGGRQGRPTSAHRFATFLRRASARCDRVMVTFHTDMPQFIGSRPSLSDVALQASWSAAWRPGAARLINSRPQIQAIVHSERSRAALIDSGVRADKITVIPHGMGSLPGDAAALRAGARTRCGAAPDEIVIGMFGFIAGYKGHLTALRALSRLGARYRLVIVGGPHPESDDRTMEVLLEHVRRHPELQGRVTITGYLPDDAAAEWVAGCDLMLAPYAAGTEVSASGALSVALASGLPVVASRVPSFIELNRQAACLDLVIPDSPNALAIAIEQLVDDPRRQETLAANARAVVGAHSWQHIAQLHEAAYDGRSVPYVTPQEASAADEVLRPPVLDPVSRRPGEHARVEVSGGRAVTFVLDPSPDRDPLADHLATYGFAHDPPNVIVRQLMGPGRRLLDVGAHIGTFSLAVVADGGRSLAIEASRDGVRNLREAVDVNGFQGRCRVVHGVAAARSGDDTLFVPQGLYGMVVDEPGDFIVESVRSVAIDDVLEAYDWETVDVVKMDIEGSEVDALAGMRRVLERCSPVFVIECNASMLGMRGHTTRELRSQLEGLGYSLHLIDRTRHHVLVETDADDVQTEGAVDLVAWRTVPTNLGDWRVGPPPGPRQIARRLAREGAREAVELRRFVALTILNAPDEVRDEPVARDLLQRLTEDHSTEVRAAARGEVDPTPYGVAPRGSG